MVFQRDMETITISLLQRQMKCMLWRGGCVFMSGISKAKVEILTLGSRTKHQNKLLGKILNWLDGKKRLQI
jgi:hypothetical protein